jgi:CarboxypepD_reg-like domain/TonB-dependent Receptor Plug Domain
MKNRILFSVLFTLINTFLFAQSGTISGKIIDKANGEGLIGAAVVLDKTTQGVVTDIEGNFSLTVPAGDYTLSVSFISYQTAKISVSVKADETTTVSHALAEAKAMLDVVVVTASAERSTSVAQMIERRKAAPVTDGISADQFKRTPDRTTSDVLKRITGASIQEGKFAIIRGMNDRYNAGYLDGALLPSTESDRKAFAFDVVPAALLDNLIIIKSGTADVVGDFGGGIIKINTKAVPEKFTQNISIGGQIHSLTTFNEFKQFKRYGSEGLSILGSDRKIPAFTEGGLKLSSTFANANDKTRLAGISQTFNNDWSNSTVNALPNARFAYSLGFPIKLKDNGKIGVIVAVNYANTRRISEGIINTFDGSGQVSNFNDKASLQNTSTGGIFNVNYVGAKTQINFRNLLNANLDNNVINRSGIGNIGDDLAVKNQSNIVNFNRLYNSILSLKQVVGNNFMTVNAGVSYSNVLREIPDYRIVNYTKTSGSDDYRLAIGDFFNTSSGRFASKLNENLVSGNVDLTKQTRIAGINTDIKVGYFYQNRDRQFNGRSFVYGGKLNENTLNPADDLGQKNISADKLFLIEKTSDDLAYYEGISNINATFISIDQNFRDKLRVVYGVRYENVTINVNNQKLKTSTAEIKEGNVLPSVNATYFLTEKANLRASYFASVNRPEFRELAPFAFFVFDKNAEIKGNKNLKVAHLNNFDVRYEFFPSAGQLMSIGGFYKTIENPVESSIDVTQPFTTFTFENEKSASIYGVELEIKKNLVFMGMSKFWSNLSLFSNLSLVKSTLKFKEGSFAKQDRPLQGQSPYIINAGLQYDSPENGWFGSAVVNRTGRRVAYAGVDPKFGDTRQDIYEAPRTVLDLQVGKNIKNMNIKLTVGDLFRQDLTFYQDADQNGKFTKSTAANADRQMFLYNNGFTASFAFSYNF